MAFSRPQSRHYRPWGWPGTPKGAPAGRPRVLVRRHVLEIKEDTRDWIEEQLEGLKETFIAGKAARSAGEILKGAVSHPAGYLSVIGALIVAAHTIPGLKEVVTKLEKDAAEAAGMVVDDFVKTGIRNVTEASSARSRDEREMYEEWVNGLWSFIRSAF